MTVETPDVGANVGEGDGCLREVVGTRVVGETVGASVGLDVGAPVGYEIGARVSDDLLVTMTYKDDCDKDEVVAAKTASILDLKISSKFAFADVAATLIPTKLIWIYETVSKIVIFLRAQKVRKGEK